MSFVLERTKSTRFFNRCRFAIRLKGNADRVFAIIPVLHLRRNQRARTGRYGGGLYRVFRGDVYFGCWFADCKLRIKRFRAFAAIYSTWRVTSLTLNGLPRNITSLVVFTRIRQCGCDSFCSFRRLFYSARVVFSSATIRQGRNCVCNEYDLLRLSRFNRGIAFNLTCFLQDEFLTPIPIIWIANVRRSPILRICRRKSARVNKARNLSASVFIFMNITLVSVNNVFH